MPQAEPSPIVLTIGHSTRTLEEFIGLLRAHAVSRVDLFAEQNPCLEARTLLTAEATCAATLLTGRSISAWLIGYFLYFPFWPDDPISLPDR